MSNTSVPKSIINYLEKDRAGAATFLIDHMSKDAKVFRGEHFVRTDNRRLINYFNHCSEETLIELKKNYCS